MRYFVNIMITGNNNIIFTDYHLLDYYLVKNLIN